MKDIVEIAVCTLAVFGIYTLFDMLKVRLLYPKKVRQRLCGVIIYQNGSDISAVVNYAHYLRREQKISPERLIILSEDDIIEGSESLVKIGDVCRCERIDINKCKESKDDTQRRE